MHRDVKQAVQATVDVATTMGLNITAQDVHRILTIFHRSMPNSTDRINGCSTWYPARILAELTGEE